MATNTPTTGHRSGSTCRRAHSGRYLASRLLEPALWQSFLLDLDAAARAAPACAEDSPEAAGKGTTVQSDWCLTRRGTQANQEEERNFSRAMVSQDFIFCAPCFQYHH